MSAPTMGVSTMASTMGSTDSAADLERRFGGLRRLYGDAAYARLRALRVAVVGLGGVGSWTVEALARSGVATLVLVDMDHVAESNINRQVQATSATLGMAKGQALAQRIVGVHPACEVHVVDAFVDEDNWPALLPCPVDVVVDACDQVRAKAAMAAWIRREHSRVAFVCTGAAGGKRDAAAIEIDDLARVTHDPLLAALRQRMRRDDVHLRGGKAIGIRCVFSREAVTLPEAMAASATVDTNVPACAVETEATTTDGSLNCHGYGSSVMVTAAFGMAAAAEAVRLALAR